MKLGTSGWVGIGVIALSVLGTTTLEGCSGSSSSPPGDGQDDAAAADSAVADDAGNATRDAATDTTAPTDADDNTDAPHDGIDAGDAEVERDDAGDAGHGHGHPDAGEDAGHEDAGQDAGHGHEDAGEDAGTDAGHGHEDAGDAAADATLPSDDAGPDASAPFDDAGPLPPPAPDAGATTSSTRHTYALRHIHLGDETNSSSSVNGWATLGYDIDGKITTATSTDVCARAAGASANAQADGVNGIDNSFGKNLVPVLATVAENPSTSMDAALAAGKFTWILDTVGIDETNGAQTATGLKGQSFRGLAFNESPNGTSTTPGFTTSDNWPLDPRSVASAVLDGGTLASPVTADDVFTGAYISDGTFVNGAPSTVTLTLLVDGYPLVLPIRHTQVSFKVTGADVTNGVLSGVVLTTDLENALLAIAGNLSVSACPGGALAQTLVTTIADAADIVHDGTNTAGTACDAVSIGIGFDAAEIGAPQVAGVPPTVVSPCAADASAD